MLINSASVGSFYLYFTLQQRYRQTEGDGGRNNAETDGKKEVKGLWMRLTEEKKRGEKQQERDKRRMKTDGGERGAEKETRVKGW